MKLKKFLNDIKWGLVQFTIATSLILSYLIFTISLLSEPISVPVKEVLIYKDRVQVTRISSIKIPVGETTYTLDATSPRLLEETLRITFSKKEPSLRITSINSYIEPIVSYNNKEVESLKKEIDTVETQKKENLLKKEVILQKKKQVYEFRKLTISHISRKVAYIEEDNFEFEKWKASLFHFKEQEMELLKEEVALNEKIYTLDKSLNVLTTKFNDLVGSSDQSNRRTDIRITNTSSAAIHTTARISYIIPGATWTPIYAVNLMKDNQAEFEYMADINQETGEDWKSVEVSISTAEPKESQVRKKIYSTEAIIEKGETQKQFYAIDKDEEKAPTDVTEDTDIVLSEGKVSQTVSSLIFKARGLYTIHSGKERHRIFISKFQHQPSVKKICIPSKQPNVFTLAKLRNKTEFPILAGKLNLFGESGFVGETNLDYIASGQEFEFPSGIDESIEVRYRVEKNNQSEKSLLSSNKKIFEREVIISLKNTDRKNHTVLIRERIPVSNTNEVTVDMDESKTTKGYTKEKEDSGILNWNLDIAANEKKEIRIYYTVTAPATSGLDF